MRKIGYRLIPLILKFSVYTNSQLELVAQSCLSLCDPRFFPLWNSPGKNTGAGSHPLLQEIFLTQKSNPSLLHCSQILYRLSHQEALN